MSATVTVTAEVVGNVVPKGIESAQKAAEEYKLAVKEAILQLKKLESLKTEIEYDVKALSRDVEDMVYAAAPYILQLNEFFKYGKKFALRTKAADFKEETIVHMLNQLLTTLERAEEHYIAFSKAEQKAYEKVSEHGKASNAREKAGFRKNMVRGFGILGTLGLGAGAVALTVLTAGAALPVAAGAVAAGATGVAGVAGGAATYLVQGKYATIESVVQALTENVLDRVENAVKITRIELIAHQHQVKATYDSIKDKAIIHDTFEKFCDKFNAIKESDLENERDKVTSYVQELKNTADKLFT